MFTKRINIIIGIIILNINYSYSIEDTKLENIWDYVNETMKKADIPGLSIALIDSGSVIVKGFGYADRENHKKITPETLFEIGSCSKAFTAFGILNLEKDNKIDLDANVSDYLPWFHVFYEDRTVNIKIKHLLHHTSGIPYYTISFIQQSNSKDALEQAVKNLISIKLHSSPGTKFEYATINYDILGLIIEKVTCMSFEEYMQKEILSKLGLNNTYVGNSNSKNLMSKGYKIGFFEPREYDSPTFRGNYPAGYFVSNVKDMVKWIQFQLGTVKSEFVPIFLKSHQRDATVIPHNLFSYAYGWDVSLKGDGQIWHGGTNPNFTTFLSFNKEKKIGLIVMANSNSPYTQSVIGPNILNLLENKKVKVNFNPDDPMDKAFSVLSIILGIYLLFVLAYFIYIIKRLIAGKRKFKKLTLNAIFKGLLVFISLLPFIYGLYVLPKAFSGVSWECALVWAPISLVIGLILCLAAMGLSYLAYLFSVMFPDKNKYLHEAPGLILLSVLSGLSNMVVILLVTSSLKNNVELKFIIYYFSLTMILYLVGRKIVQTKMIYLSRNVIYDLRMKLVNKVFSTSYEKFEKIDRGRVYSTMNDDIGTIGQSTNTFVNITTSIITAGGAFIYMATLAFWATVVTVLLVGVISTVYYIVSNQTRNLFEDARETRTVYMRLLNGMIDGFKELSIHRNKKLEYKNELEATTDEYRQKISIANVKFVNAFLIGESLLIVLLAVVTFIIPRIFTNIQFYTVMSFVIILLYLIGPVNSILGAIPQLMQFRIAWDRVQKFIHDIPANLNFNALMKSSILYDKKVKSLEARDITFNYENENNDSFSVGPINFKLFPGEALFIIGGNGSGKTTLAKLLTGLYAPQNGNIYINNQKLNENIIGEYFSTVFNPFHLFKKIYDLEEPRIKSSLIQEYLELLGLKDKVNIIDNVYDTIDLSGGQRKRLALLQCYIEDRPIYLFDEWAADQDPIYRKVFYKELIVEMKRKGKIIIAITHDDHYFDVADKILKMDMGKMEFIKETKNIKITY